MFTADLPSQSQDSVNQQVLHPGSRQLFRYWESLRADRKCPTRAEFSLHRVKELISHLFIWEMDSRTGSFVYRLAGTGITDIFRAPKTGKDVFDGWDPFERSVISKVLGAAANQLQPGLIRVRLFAEHNQIVGAEIIALPISVPGRSQIQLIGGMFPFTNPNELAYTKIIDQQLVTARTIWTEHVNDMPAHAEPDPMREPHKPHFRVIQGGLSG